MIDFILLNIGITGLIIQLFVKWNIWDWIALKGSGSKYKFIYRVSQCRFCLTFYISITITLILGVILSFSWNLILVPFACTGLINLITKG